MKLITIAAVWALFAVSLSAADSFRWSVQYLIDNSRIVFGRPQNIAPRHCRGLALSADGRSLYAGYIHSFDNAGEVRRLSTGTADFDAAPLAVLRGPRGQAIATDDCGRVYIADEEAVLVYDAALAERQLSIPVHGCEGLAVAREEGVLALYTSDRAAGTIIRWNLAEKGLCVTCAKAEGLKGDGALPLPTGVDAHGIELDAAGQLWIADGKGNQVIRFSADRRAWLGVPVSAPCDLAVDGDRVYVTRSGDLGVTVMDLELNIVGTLAVPWEILELSPHGHRSAQLSGITAWPGHGFFVANEGGKTAGRRSTFGPSDERSDFLEGRLFRDAFGDDNEPILRAERVKPEP